MSTASFSHPLRLLKKTRAPYSAQAVSFASDTTALIKELPNSLSCEVWMTLDDFGFVGESAWVCALSCVADL